jgi:hypothetical protein
MIDAMFMFAEAADPVSGVTSYLFTQGVLGFVLVVLGFAFYKYYHSAEAQKKADAKTIFDLQEARRLDYKETTKEVTEVLQNNSQNLRILTEKIEVGKSLERMS